jgi:predicted MFS family arabinose efflux permease
MAGFAGAGVMLLAAFVWRERRAEEPFVDPLLFKRRLFLAANAGGFFGMAALYSASAYVPLLVRGVREGSPQAAGLALMPLSLGWVAASIVGGRMLLRTGYRPTTALGTVCIAAGGFGLATLTAAASDVRLYSTLALMGIGLGLAMTGFIVAVQGAAPQGRMGIITSSVLFFRSLGAAVGVAVHGAVMLASLERHGVDPGLLSPVAEGVAGGAAASSEPLMAALHGVFVAGLVFALAAVPAGFAMPGGRPEAHTEASRR